MPTYKPLTATMTSNLEVKEPAFTTSDLPVVPIIGFLAIFMVTQVIVTRLGLKLLTRQQRLANEGKNPLLNG